MDEPCYVCGQPGLAQCSRCHSVTYCGPECQRSDWKQHKGTCTSTGLSSLSQVGSRLNTGRTQQAVLTPCKDIPASDTATPSSARPTFPVRSHTGVPGQPAPFDVTLRGERSIENAQRIVDVLKKRGVCVVRAGAEKVFHRALALESQTLWESGEFGEAQKGRPISPGSEQIHFDVRDDRVVWLTSEWVQKNERRCKALKVLDGQLEAFGFGLKQLLEDQLGLTLQKRTCGMLACYAGDASPGAHYDFHIDNPYQTQMEVPDDKRRLTVVYYINDGPWDVHTDGGALQVCLATPTKAPRTASEALLAEKLTIAPECDTMAVFFSHTMYHAVLPVVSRRRRFALSAWFNCP